jgi:hypothetical protein
VLKFLIRTPVNKMNLDSTMLHATNDDTECGMWDVDCGVMYKREKQKLICNFFMDSMKVEINQWEWENRV